MTKIAIVGVSGRMGKTLVEAISMDNSATLAAAIDRQDSPMIGRDINNNHIAIVSSLSLIHI